MRKISACIFDLDGVIVDTAKYHYEAWNAIAKDLGFEFTWEENEKLKGLSRTDSLEIILSIGNISLSDKDKQFYLVQKNNSYLDLIKGMDESEILPGVKRMLDELKYNKIKIGLGSASKNAISILETVNLIKYFDSIIDGNGVSRGKPDPQVFELGAKELGVHPRECIVFEDSRSGIDAANDGGFISIGIGSPEVLNKAAFVISAFTNETFESLTETINKIAV